MGMTKTVETDSSRGLPNGEVIDALQNAKTLRMETYGGRLMQVQRIVVDENNNVTLRFYN